MAAVTKKEWQEYCTLREAARRDWAARKKMMSTAAGNPGPLDFPDRCRVLENRWAE